MQRNSIICVFSLLCCLMPYKVFGRGVNVLDSVSRQPIGGAAVFDRDGNFMDVSDEKGKLAEISAHRYPVTVRCIGYKQLLITEPTNSFVLSRNVISLPEVTVLQGKDVYVHLLGFVLEYSILTTYTDSIALFREKWIDYMVPSSRDSKFKGWTSPRVLSTRSYYHFTNHEGLDSVSDRSNHHFSWSDWIGIAEDKVLPGKFVESGNDSIPGQYGWKEIWNKNEDRIEIGVDVLADSTNRSWIPGLSGFFHKDTEFDMFKMKFVYGDHDSGKLEASALQAISFNIDSRGRGRNMFMFNRVGMPFFVSTYGEIYIVDKEYLRAKEAKGWYDSKFDYSDFENLPLPSEISELPPETMNLISRVENINHVERMLSIKPDPILIGPERKKLSAGGQILNFLNNIRKHFYVRDPKINKSKMRKK